MHFNSFISVQSENATGNLSCWSQSLHSVTPMRATMGLTRTDGVRNHHRCEGEMYVRGFHGSCGGQEGLFITLEPNLSCWSRSLDSVTPAECNRLLKWSLSSCVVSARRRRPHRLAHATALYSSFRDPPSSTATHCRSSHCQ
jgi:hypothetical protein